MKKEINISQEVTSAVSTIRSAILLSQERAVKAINHRVTGTGTSDSQE